MARWSWVNLQCRGVLLIWIRVEQGPTALAVGAGGGCLDIFSLVYHFSFPSPPPWETARYRLKYCLKGPLSPKQPTDQPILKMDYINLFSRGMPEVVALLLAKQTLLDINHFTSFTIHQVNLCIHGFEFFITLSWHS